jgi:menaquinone reductase, multiheme cytochrome c subunit
MSQEGYLMEKPEHSHEKHIKKDSRTANTFKTLAAYLLKMFSNPIKNGLLYFISGLAAALLIGWVLFPILLYSREDQPFNFSHAVHTDPDMIDGMDGKTEAERCSLCHSFRSDGTFTGIPELSKCLECHDPESPLGESNDEKLFLKQYAAADKEIPWHQYYRQPDNVYFSHIAHVNNGKVECSTCHGDHGKSKTMPVYEKNRISGYSIDIWGRNISGLKTNTWDRMKMDNCAECHAKTGHKENNECFVCHK